MSSNNNNEGEPKGPKGRVTFVEQNPEERLQKMEEALAVRIIKYEQPKLATVKRPGGGYISKKPRTSLLLAEDIEITCGRLTKRYDAIFTDKELEILVHNMFPDLVWEDDYSVYTRSVSFATATKQDILDVIIEIQDKLEGPNVSQFNTSERYANLLIQALDECIRQVVVERAVHGVLFRLIRDYFRKVFVHKRGLYTSSIAFYGRRDIQLTNDIRDLQLELEEKDELISRLSRELDACTSELNNMEDKFQSEVNGETQDFMSELTPILNEKRRYLQKLKHMSNAEGSA